MDRSPFLASFLVENLAVVDMPCGFRWSAPTKTNCNCSSLVRVLPRVGRWIAKLARSCLSKRPFYPLGLTLSVSTGGFTSARKYAFATPVLMVLGRISILL